MLLEPQAHRPSYRRREPQLRMQHTALLPWANLVQPSESSKSQNSMTVAPRSSDVNYGWWTSLIGLCSRRFRTSGRPRQPLDHLAWRRAASGHS